ncbi:MAG: biopolymer transporter ExbD [Phycisphaeraceae bacterium]|nr:biopolymer transporter ExbD [Phycisphaeraceae bacterium]
MLIRNADASADLHIDFVPMVDVLFNLLIFFLIATSMVQAEREMKIALPHAASSGPISASLRDLVINVNAEGRAFVGGKEMDDGALSQVLKSALAANPDQKVSVRGDRAASYASVAHVLDVCKGAGAQQPYLETIPLR